MALVWLLALLGGSVVGLLLRLTLFLLAAAVLQLTSQLLAILAPRTPLLDPVYTQAALSSLTDLHLQGLAVAGPPGDWLHAHFPTLFVDSSRAQWAAVRIAVQPGSPIMARLVATTLAHAGVLGIGLLVVRAGWRKRHLPLTMAGLAVQLQVAVGILGARPSVRELEATGLSFAANALLPWVIGRGAAIGDIPAATWPPLLGAALVALALLVGYLPTGVILLARNRARRVAFGSAAAVMLSSAACAGLLQPHAQAATAATVASPALVPLPLADAPAPSSHAVDAIGDRWFADAARAQAALPPSRVQIVGSGGTFQYLVNGQAQIIKGMGLNTQYRQQLTPAERADQLDRDMAALNDLGVNTVLGWDPAEFDTVLLDAAQRHGLGVVMPFDLDPQADYTDPSVRQTLHDQVLDWVRQYRDHPALRMWGLGNEVLHKIVHPAWVGPQDARQAAQATAFSDWLVSTADDIHALDADHPVTYRSAEDAFVDWITAALRRAGGGPRPWFVWGTNCYQKHLAEIVDRWPESGMDAPLWVSEFAPGGMAVPDRPAGFATMWSYVRRNPQWVLGGAVYAWTRNGPEGVDRTFGLTDDGVPVDGRSLDMLSSLFHTE